MNRLTHILEQMRSHAYRPCIEDENTSYTYSQLLEEVASWHMRLNELDVRCGSVVGVRSDYSLTAVAALLALLERRAVAALIPRDRAADHYLPDAHASFSLEISRDGGYQCCVVRNSSSHPLLDQLRMCDDSGIVIFTSGSTGRPKAALQSVERFLRKFDKPGRRLRTLAFLLLDHIGGLDTLFYTLANGGSLITVQRRDPATILRLIESRRIQVLPTSPSFLRMLCVARETSGHDLSSLEFITYGSEPMDPDTLGRVNALFPRAQISQKYGTTEIGSPRTVSRHNSSLWLKIKNDGVETKIIDGVLWVRGDGTMLGYLNAASPIDDQGWYCTGDMVDVDGEWITFRGRSSDIINVGGEKVTPIEIERLLLELDFVSGALVSGEPHGLMGQVPCAKVTLSSPSIDPREAVRHIRAYCREHLAPYKVPMKIEVVSEGGFTNERQKLRRHGARQHE